ncbi:origin recognition complex subunit [Histoplasma capsulatum var. duboisii H88]|uniref:Origin recognition complex subunit 1 n=1 Tax=Ajellomyces capsulatus (strain H88) TaxID=544711 RepID=F0UAS1_AJEC8|nr:origin recognition complex subunit [Histoplasma capsulatum var. duboisii H88]QSS49126.1 origin recognition complex subunit [Histoplasma capsulatum var. duboisii H88]
MAPTEKTEMRKMKRNRTEELAKQWLTKGGVYREDSDDELGYEDHPWEWIYEADQASTGDTRLSDSDDETNCMTPTNREVPHRSRRKATKKIIGARMGSFECRLGQAVLLKSPEPGKDWAGIICEFLEEEEEGDDEDDEDEDGAGSLVKSANIMWFASPDEFLGTKNKRREDALPNEQYITMDFNVNPLTSIDGKAIVLSRAAFEERYPNGIPPKGRAALAEYHKCIICRRGVNQLQGKYTEEFVWEDIFDGTEEGLFALIDFMKAGLKRSRKRKGVDDDYADVKENGSAPTTPRKKHKSSSVAGTPQSRHRRKVLTTPTHKRIVVKKPVEFTPLGTRILSPSHFTSSPYRQARNLLHVSSVPASLPCRDSEFNTVYDCLRLAITDGTGTCIYISGPPGTGKTATVREVIAQLNASVLAEELDDFVFVEINGMKVTDPHQSYSLLWEALKGDRVSPSHALDLLEREFSHPSPRRVPCVVLMDELDQLVTKNQSVMYNFFNWPALRYSHLIVLAVANTMDLPERTLSNKISSRLGLTRITFSGYKYQELMEIIGSRLSNVPGNLVDPDAIQFASRKVAAVSGDARRALDICRRAVEIAEQASEIAEKAKLKSALSLSNRDGIHMDDMETSSLPPTPSKSASRRNRVAGPAHNKLPPISETESNPLPRVTIATIKQAIQEATSTPLQQSLRCLPLTGKVFLAGLLARIRRTGITESTFGDILDEAKRVADAAVAVAGAASSNLKAYLLQKGSDMHISRVCAMRFAAVELMNSGILALEGELSAKGSGSGTGHALGGADRSGKVRLRIASEDVRAAFREDEEAKMLGLGFEQ